MAYTKEQLELKAFLDKRAEENCKKAEANPDTTYFNLTTDVDHWIESGINSVDEFEHNEAASTFSDFFKELNGFRPRHLKISTMTTAELNLEIDSLNEQQLAEDQYQADFQKSEDAKALARKEANKYQPNHALAGLGDLMKQ